MFNALPKSSTPGDLGRKAAVELTQNASRNSGKSSLIVSNTGIVSLRPGSFSLDVTGVQFIPSMSRTRKATHRTRDLAVGIFRCSAFSRLS
ncbi:hypothetical protein LJR129_001516 [Acidovorax sp. LjRoot129]|uniref:hypothetical protein n=1 Tax=Acidovorax sp. LjRoot129 TaxID=3342260 RepID=UPI003ECC6E83